jgi:PAS domain S-box-containing protein
MSKNSQDIAEPLTPTLLSEALLAAASEAIVATDGDGTIWFWNPGAERIFGYASTEVTGRSLDIIIPERLRARHWEGFRKVMAGGRSRYGEGDVLAVPGIRKDGGTISLEFTIVPLRDLDGRMIGMGAVMRDVTARFNELRMLRRKALRGDAADH